MSSSSPVLSDPLSAPQEEWREASEVGTEESRTAWAEAARPVLIEVAHRYHSVITYKELAAEVQRVTGIRTKQLTHYWIGDVLGRVGPRLLQPPGTPALGAVRQRRGQRR